MSSRFLILGGLAAVAVLSLGWSAIAADGDGEDGRGADRWPIPVPPPLELQGEKGSGHVEVFRHGPLGPGAEGDGPPGMPLPPHPDGPFGIEEGELTWGELHVQRDGEDVVVRIDRGEVASMDSDSITVAESDGNDVEIPIDEDTVVRAGPFSEGSLDDLEQGDQVMVHREDGGPAEVIGVLPEMHFARPGREEG